MNFRVKYRTTRSKFENLSRFAALTQFVQYISDETPQNHSINSPKHPKALENYGITRQKLFKDLKLHAKRVHTQFYANRQWTIAVKSSILGHWSA